jgi:hypothetical protein
MLNSKSSETDILSIQDIPIQRLITSKNYISSVHYLNTVLESGHDYSSVDNEDTISTLCILTSEYRGKMHHCQVSLL